MGRREALSREIRCLTCAALLAAGCGAAGSGDVASVTDSAGVRIVYSQSPRWSATQSWRMADEPMLRIGEDMDDERYTFTRIRRTLALPDGRIVVAHAGSPPDIRVFGADGIHMRTIGRPGAGPGEFRAVWDAWLAGGDTIVVFDATLSRVSYFRAIGELVRVVDLRQNQESERVPVAGALPWGRFPDATFYLRPNRFMPEETVGEGRGTAPALRVRDDGTLVDTIGVFPEADYYTAPRAPAQPRFGRLATIAVLGNSIYRGMGDDFTIDQYDITGRHVRSLRRAAAAKPVTDELLERLLAHDLEAAAPDRQDAIRADYASRPRAATLPAYGSRIIMDDLGNIWVQPYTTPLDEVGDWTVFDDSGRWLGGVTMPTAFQPHAIGSDWVLGVWKDPRDVESVRRYHIVKP